VAPAEPGLEMPAPPLRGIDRCNLETERSPAAYGTAADDLGCRFRQVVPCASPYARLLANELTNEFY
jgi:hypothetical protein